LKLGDKNTFRHPMCLKNGRQIKFWRENEWGYGDGNYRHLLFSVVTKQLFRHTMRMEFGDKDIFRHPMCLKNRRQMKFWWENEIDYGDEKTSSSIICSSDETNIPSLNMLEIG
jgi:hypothetical protein